MKHHMTHALGQPLGVVWFACISKRRLQHGCRRCPAQGPAAHLRLCLPRRRCRGSRHRDALDLLWKSDAVVQLSSSVGQAPCHLIAYSIRSGRLRRRCLWCCGPGLALRPSAQAPSQWGVCSRVCRPLQLLTAVLTSTCEWQSDVCQLTPAAFHHCLVLHCCTGESQQRSNIYMGFSHGLGHSTKASFSRHDSKPC